MLEPATLRFLSTLKKNNHKGWMDAHRDLYEQAKQDFIAFVEALIREHGKKDPSIAGLRAKDCIFRINRDIRFSKDKSPYKTNMGAFLNKSGKKGITAGYYFHLEPGQSFAGGGLYLPMPEVLGKVRQEIDYNLPEFKKILQASAFKSVYGTLDNSKEYLMSRVPKGYEADNPAAAWLKLKSFIAFRPITNEELTGKQLLRKTLQAFAALQPLVAFLNRSIED